MCYTKIAFHNCVKPSTLPPSMYKLEGYINLLDPWCIHIKKRQRAHEQMSYFGIPLLICCLRGCTTWCGNCYSPLGMTCFTAPAQCFQVFYMCTFQRCCARVRDVVHVSQQLCTFPSSCARFTEVAHVSQKLCTFHKPPNNVRAQLHWGDQTRSPESITVYGCVLVNQHDGIGIFFMAQRVTYQHVRLKRLEGLTRQSRHGYGDGLQTCFEDFFWGIS